MTGLRPDLLLSWIVLPRLRDVRRVGYRTGLSRSLERFFSRISTRSGFLSFGDVRGLSPRMSTLAHGEIPNARCPDCFKNRLPCSDRSYLIFALCRRLQSTSTHRELSTHGSPPSRKRSGGPRSDTEAPIKQSSRSRHVSSLM